MKRGCVHVSKANVVLFLKNSQGVNRFYCIIIAVVIHAFTTFTIRPQ
jgi:hypothetical protein